ncbi:MAG: DUF192 domain-containing protein [Candidatus Limnocylindria bacterium]
MARRVRIENHTRGTTIADKARIARTLRDRTVGLLGTSGLEPASGLLIERAPSIHMFFMRFAIDVIFVDAALHVTRVVEGLRPWRVVWSARGGRDCVELPVGAIASSQTQVGDELALVDPDEC